MIYLDNAATTKTAPEVVEAMLPYFSEYYGNPSSIYAIAGKSKEAITKGREQIANVLGAKPEEIYFTAGGSESDNWALKATFEAYKNKGNHIITTKIEHHAILHTCEYLEKERGAKVTYVGVDENGVVNLDELEAAITPKTRMLILCSPSNPTGSVYSKEELAALAEVIKKHEDLYVLADEIYEHINYIGHHESIAQFPGMKDRAIIVNGVSKAYAMTGWRIGFIAAPQWIVKGCNKLQGQYTSGPCSVSQKAAEAAYTLPQDCVETMRQAFERRRDLIVELAKDIPGLEVNKPEGAFYLFPKCSSFFGKSDGQHTISNSTDLAMYLLEEGHVATVGGDAFGDPECFRMSYATSDDNIREAMRRIKEALARLK